MASRCVEVAFPPVAARGGRGLAGRPRASTPTGPAWWRTAPAATSTGPACSPHDEGYAAPARAVAVGAGPAGRRRRDGGRGWPASCSSAAEAGARPAPRPARRRARGARASRPSRSASAAVPGRKDVVDRQHREERRWRTDELRAGLAILSRAYRDRLADGRDLDGPSLAECERAVVADHRTPRPRSSATRTRRSCSSRCWSGSDPAAHRPGGRRAYDTALLDGRSAAGAGGVTCLGSSVGRAAHS